MKLNTKRTVLVGFAFLSICAFWQMYNSVIPLILTNTFHMSETISGVIMSADNILALFLLPLFGAISDRCKSPLGRRRPFILFGTVAAVALMLFLPVLDNSYAAAPAPWKLGLFITVLGGLLVAMGSYRSPAVALMPDVTPKPLRSKGNAIINLMGAVGGVTCLLIARALYPEKKTAGLDPYQLFSAVRRHCSDYGRRCGGSHADRPGAEVGRRHAGMGKSPSGGKSGGG
jgi:maltose/moltooligosaccharide transporter